MRRRAPDPMRQRNVAKVAEAAKERIFALGGMALQGREGAAAELHSAAVLATECLTLLCARRPELVRPIAHEKFWWPVLLSPHRDRKAKAEELILDLEVGSKTGINLEKGAFSWDDPANKVALYLYDLAQTLQRAPMKNWDLRDWFVMRSVGRITKQIADGDPRQRQALEEWGQRGPGKELPPLSKETAKQWASITPQFFPLVYGEKFDQHPDLQELKGQVKGSALDAERRPGGAGVVRRAMVVAVKQAWRSIAAWDK